MTEEDRRRLIEEERLRRKVYGIIVQLSDVVSEETLLDCLQYLDPISWMEMVEERNLGRMCGYPTCSNNITMVPSSKQQKYRIDRSKKQFVESALCERTEREKFCSTCCYKQSIDAQQKLNAVPIWLTNAKKMPLSTGTGNASSMDKI